MTGQTGRGSIGSQELSSWLNGGFSSEEGKPKKAPRRAPLLSSHTTTRASDAPTAPNIAEGCAAPLCEHPWVLPTGRCGLLRPRLLRSLLSVAARAGLRKLSSWPKAEAAACSTGTVAKEALLFASRALS